MGEIGEQKNNGTHIPLHQIDTTKMDERIIRNGAIIIRVAQEVLVCQNKKRQCGKYKNIQKQNM